MHLTVTLTSAAVAAIIGVWLTFRVIQLRAKFGVAHGHGDNDALMRRMRAQLNYAENTPLVLILIAGIELSGKADIWLSYVAAVYFLGRLAHAVGMDSESVPVTRKIGMASTLLVLIGLAIYALLVALKIV
ncbi:GST-like protein [Erythrobacter sp. SG61-1L]|uniref:MAPEG family protein n=1 Tax=Erythrobacter sp. SG61-1L TaxID=1603897 RepID=UPI0006C8F6BA|nr:MAPEG family protein [Erythrobacter sp. SG61-1L]KPL67126.1 GST-like protein [Erythrobacter sp. SG61-1L]